MQNKQFGVFFVELSLAMFQHPNGIFGNWRKHEWKYVGIQAFEVVCNSSNFTYQIFVSFSFWTF
jgi:hypothetical protein